MTNELTIKDYVNSYVSLRQHLEEVDLKKKELERMAGEDNAILLSYMEANGIVSLESDSGHIISKSARGYSEVIDAQSLMDWANAEGDEYVSERWELLNRTHAMKGVEQGVFVTKPNTKLCNILVKHYMHLAETTGRDLSDLLPPGLSTTLTPILSLRKPTKSAATKPLSATLLELAMQGAAEEENE